MHPLVLAFQDIDRTALSLVGGKGANLGELTRIDGIHVPDGFCISTEAFKRIIGQTPAISAWLDQLTLLKAEDRDQISACSRRIRSAIEATAIPSDIEEEIVSALSRLGEKNAYAVRSSATAEDLPAAFFAGQQDSWLNIIGKESVLSHVSKCWASLFTDRAVTYRIQNGFDHRKVYLSVVIQQMVFPQAAGVLFTADPVTGNRKVSSIDAVFGLSETFVSGLVNADGYKVCGGAIIDQRAAGPPVLTTEQMLRLEHIGRTIEAHFGSPQDIEWCLADGVFYIVQARPITTLYPIPDADDQEKHVYISVGHQQMMIDAMRPLGLSLFQLRSMRPMFKAGGRLFVDVADSLTTPSGSAALLDIMGQHDPLIKDALMTIIERKFIKPAPDNEKAPAQNTQPTTPKPLQPPIENDPAIARNLIQCCQDALKELKHNIQTKSGPELFDFILEDIRQSKKRMFDSQNMAVLMTGINASRWINEKMQEWIGEKGVADALSQSVPNNITSEMGLALLDLTDVIRPYPAVIEYLQQVKDDHFLAELPQLDGGQETKAAIDAFLEKYGMRCVGEIDITRSRWSESPSILIPMILGNIKNFEPGAGHRKFEKGRQEALKKEAELLARLKQLPDGKQKAEEAKEKISLLRNFIGYREYPKYDIVSRSFVYRQYLLKEADRLLQSSLIHEKEDIYYLTFEELSEVVRANRLDYPIIDKRKATFRAYEKLTPPRVITSDGEIITGHYKRENLPAAALIGLPVSAGVIEGRARIILNIEDADLQAGDILVTSFTDPSWTPLFVSIKGLVTEVGGLMTHGAVIAREYGLPAVIGVENATRLIKDGQHIRVHGTDGYVEILS